LNEYSVDEKHWDHIFFELARHSGSDTSFVLEVDHKLEVHMDDVIHEVNQKITVVQVNEWNLSDKSQHESEHEDLGNVEVLQSE
jgi:hypothetical protein